MVSLSRFFCRLPAWINAFIKNVLYTIFTTLLRFVLYVLPFLAAAALVGIPISHIWVDFSWWWMFAPVAAGFVWVAAVVMVSDAIGG